MAVHDRDYRNKMVLLSTFLVLYLTTNFSWGQKIPTMEIVSQWASDVDQRLVDLNEMFAVVNKTYQKKAKEKSSTSPGLTFRYEVVNQKEVAEEMAASLSELLHRHMMALEKSVKAAESAAAAYKWNNDLMKDDVTYMNAKELKEKGVDLIYSDKFGREVNDNFSSVHIPVEIYDGNINILNGLNWTAALEEQFKKNQEEDPEILWQYFGSQTGFLRTYPAAQWPKDDVDLYDVRRQSWYTQGSSSPKDMMILIDKSGSTHGQSLKLMQNAVKSILATLGENDFVNIVEFAESASIVGKCFNHTAFVQANFRNKQRLIKDIDKLVANGQADFSEAVRFAFEKFNEFSGNGSNVNNIGSNCNKVIMLLTDGGTDSAEDVFDEYNWPNKTVRVFTYAVGPTPNPVKALRWMACANRGYFSHIPAMGAIRARVQDYMRVLARPLAQASAEIIQWIGIHRDTYHDYETEYIPVLSRPLVIRNEKVFEWGNIYEDYLELGMMTTVTLPVYNHSADSTNQTILGVMAIDVTTAQLEAMTPISKIGPNGYSFAINPNGYVVFHPNLRTTGKFMIEPPNIDMLELEADENSKDLQNLRTAMIEGKSGLTKMSTLFLSPDLRYTSSNEAVYAYMPIKNTTFSLGLCVPTYQRKYLNFTGEMDKFDWSIGNSSLFKVLIAPWEYHKHMKHIKGLSGTLDDIVSLLLKDPKPDNWVLDLLYHLYWDVTHIEQNVTTFLKKFVDMEVAWLNYNRTSSSLFRVGEVNRTVFLMTSGGMTLVSPPSEVRYFQAERELRNSSLFKRALHSTQSIFVTDYSRDKRSNNSAVPYIVTARGVLIKESLDNGKENIIDKPAVAGERLSHDAVINVVIEATKKITNYKTCEDESLVCYLVDDGGFLVATTRDDYREQIGRFFGEVDPPIFSALSNKTVFLRTVQHDFQATCTEDDNMKSAGFRDFYIPSINLLFDMLSVGWWTSKVSWAITSFSTYSWLTSPSTQVFAQHDSDDDDYDDDDDDKEKECVVAIYQYSINSQVSQLTDSIKCQNCTRNVMAVKLNLTNLLFIVADKICEDCDELYDPVSQAPKELSETEEEDIVCEMAQNPRKRIQPSNCFHYDSREDVSECGCAALQASCVSFFLTLVSIMLLVYHNL